MFFQENGQYRCAVYLRLSRSDGDQQESNSIKNQRALLNDYMGKHPELHKVDEYVDDGFRKPKNGGCVYMRTIKLKFWTKMNTVS